MSLPNPAGKHAADRDALCPSLRTRREVKRIPFSRRICVRVLLILLRAISYPGQAEDIREFFYRCSRVLLRSPGLQIKRRRNAGRRSRPNLRAIRARLARSVARTPTGVPPRHLRQRTNATAQLQHVLPGTRLRNGRYPLPPVPVQRVHPRTGRDASRTYSPKPPGSRVCRSARGNRSRSAAASTPVAASFVERDLQDPRT